MGRVSSAPFAGASTDTNPSLRLLDEMLSWTRPVFIYYEDFR